MPDHFRMADLAPASCGSPRCMVLSSDRSPNRFPDRRISRGGNFIPHRTGAGRSNPVSSAHHAGAAQHWKLYMENVKDSYHASILHLVPSRRSS